MRPSSVRRVLLAVAFTALVPVAVLAHVGATGIVLERMEAMKEIADGLKAISPMAKGEADFDADEVRAVAAMIERHAREMPDLFPEGSLQHVSEARPEIWDDWDRFVGYARDMEQAASAMAEVEDAEAFAASMREIGATCKSCHEAFRIEK